MSWFLYMHKDMSKHDNVWKIGIAKTPYSAVRARQKFCWDEFGLDYLYFGEPSHIAILEEQIKTYFYKRSGKYLNNIGSQTELFLIDEQTLKGFIDTQISQRSYLIKEIALTKPYSASNSGSCPFGIPIETRADEWLEKKFKDLFECNSWYGLRQDIRRVKLDCSYIFNRLFKVEE